MGEVTRDCPYCAGDGCSECDGTGQRVRTTWQDGDMQVSVSGSAPLSPEAQEALQAIARVAFDRMAEE